MGPCARRRLERWAAAAAVLALVLAGATPAGSEPAPSPSAGDGRRTLSRLPVNLGRGFVGFFNQDNLVPFVVGSVATGGSTYFDDNLKSWASNPDSGFGKGLGTAGGWPTAVAVAGLFTAGRFAHGSRFRAMTYDIGAGAGVTLAYTQLLKLAVRRERPDGSSQQSFPSGHTANAFMWATVLERHYGWKLGVPAYAFAATMGYSRIVRDKHYLSDVVAGATLGYIAARTVLRVNGQPLGPSGPRAALGVSPIVTRSARGLQVSLMF